MPLAFPVSWPMHSALEDGCSTPPIPRLPDRIWRSPSLSTVLEQAVSPTGCPSSISPPSKWRRNFSGRKTAELLIDAISLSWSIGDRNSLPSPFWWASILLAPTGRFESSVIVTEGAKTVSFGTALTLEPRLTASLQEALELSRAELGGDLYQGASDRAVSMSIESMIDFVLLELRTVTSDA